MSNSKKINYHIMDSDSSHLCWSPFPLILFPLEKGIKIRTPEGLLPVKADRLAIINSQTPYAISQVKGLVLAFSIQIESFCKEHDLPTPSAFEAESVEAMAHLRSLLAAYVITCHSQNRYSQLHEAAIENEIIYQLISFFAVQSVEAGPSKSQGLTPGDFLSYLDQNYRDQLSLELVAKHFFLTPQYFSAKFKEAVGLNFNAYLREVRLSHAIDRLNLSDDSVEQIAADCGFPSARALGQSMKEKYGLLPSQYREQKRETLPIEFSSYDLSHLNAFLSGNKSLPATPDQARTFAVDKVAIPSVSATENGIRLNHSATEILTVENAADLLLSSVREMLTDACSQINFRYIRVHGILSDDILYCKKEIVDGQCSVTVNLYNVFSVLDFILSLGLKPMLEFSYLPNALRPDDYENGVFLPYNICLPDDHEDWRLLIREFMSELVLQYGLSELKTWLFYPWNQPDNFMAAYVHVRTEDFYEIYRITYETLKSIDPALIVGTPSMMDFRIETGEWFDAFLNYCQKEDCLPEFMQYSYYAYVPDKGESNGLPFISAKLDQDAFKNSLYHVVTQQKKKWKIKKLYVPEWQFTLGNEALYDTTFYACYVVRNMVENIDRIAGFGASNLTDFSTIFPNHFSHFQARRGLYTYSGIRKPVFYAYRFLSRMGENMIGRGPGYLITEQDGAIQILLYYYVHFTEEYVRGERLNNDPGTIYDMFETGARLRFELPLCDLKNRVYRLTRESITRDSGSAYDIWLRGNALSQANLSTRSELAYLKDQAIPKTEKSSLMPTDGKIILSETLLPLEVRWIELR